MKKKRRLQHKVLTSSLCFLFSLYSINMYSEDETVKSEYATSSDNEIPIQEQSNEAERNNEEISLLCEGNNETEIIVSDDTKRQTFNLFESDQYYMPWKNTKWWRIHNNWKVAGWITAVVTYYAGKVCVAELAASDGGRFSTSPLIVLPTCVLACSSVWSFLSASHYAKKAKKVTANGNVYKPDPWENTRDWKIRRRWKTAGMCMGIMSGIYLSVVFMMDCGDRGISFGTEYMPGIMLGSMSGISYIVASSHASNAKLSVEASAINNSQIMGRRNMVPAACLCFSF